MQRRTLIAVVCAAAVGGTSGTLAALRLAHRRRAAHVASAPTAGSGSAVGSDGAGSASSAESHVILTAQTKRILERFTLWTRDHADAACPDLISLGVPTMDPWGHDLVLTCTDQPANQRIGVISAGPDGQPGTDDDIFSWTMGPAITRLVQGPRWQPLTAAPSDPQTPRPAATPARTSSPAATSPRPSRTSAPATPTHTSAPAASTPSHAAAPTGTKPSRTTAPNSAPTSPPSATSPSPTAPQQPSSSQPASPDSDDIPTRRSSR